MRQWKSDTSPFHTCTVTLNISGVYPGYSALSIKEDILSSLSKLFHTEVSLKLQRVKFLQNISPLCILCRHTSLCCCRHWKGWWNEQKQVEKDGRRVFRECKYSLPVLFVDLYLFKTVAMQPQKIMKLEPTNYSDKLPWYWRVFASTHSQKKIRNR